MSQRPYAGILALCLLTCWAGATTYYVSTSGSSGNDGLGTDRPLPTIAAAVSRVQNGDTVLLCRGDVFRESAAFARTGLLIGAYGAAADPRPVVSGSVVIAGWTRYQGDIWTATASTVVENLYADNQFVWIARWPNAGTLPAPFARVQDLARSGEGYTINSRHLTQNPRDANGYWVGGRVRLRRWNWWYETRNVTGYTTTGSLGSLTTDGGSSHWELGSASVGMYLENKLTELDTANEWVINPGNRMVYLWAPGGADPNTMTIEGTVRDRGFTVTSCRVENICFRQLKGPALSITGTSAVDRCAFENVGGDGGGEGLRAESGARNAQVTNCSFREMLNIGIHWLETTSGSHSLIEADTIRHVGIRPGYGSRMGTWHENRLNVHYCGIAVSYGKNLTIRNCVTDSTGYAGINPMADSMLIERNIVRYGMATLNDGAGIYAPTNYTTFRNNIILNTIGEIWAGNAGGTAGSNISHGLWIEYAYFYHDNKVFNNTMAWSGCHGFWLPNNKRTTVTGNVVYGNANAQMRLDIGDKRDSSAQANTISQNQFYATSPSQRVFSYLPRVPFGSVSGNWYCSPYTDSVVDRSEYDRFTLAAWPSVDAAQADRSARTDLVKRPANPAPGDLTGTSKLLINYGPSRGPISTGDNGVYQDLAGNTVTGSATLDPYTSLIIVHTGQVSTAVRTTDRIRAVAPHVRASAGAPLALHLTTTDPVRVELRVYDARGSLVHRQARVCQAGPNALVWSDVAPGLYTYELRAGDRTPVRGAFCVPR